jgi:hypothetical protein
MGPHEVGLNAGSGSVQPLPSNVPTPTSQATVAATAGPLPTDDIELPQAPPGSATPRPPGPLTNADEDGDDGPPLWGIMVVALMGLGVLGGAAGFALSRREARENPDEPENGGGPG